MKHLLLRHIASQYDEEEQTHSTMKYHLAEIRIVERVWLF